MTDDNCSWMPPPESPGGPPNAEENAKNEEARPAANLMKSRSSFAVKLLNLVLSILAFGLVMEIFSLWNPTWPGLGGVFLVAYYFAITLPYVLILLIFVALPILCVVYLIVRRILYAVRLIVRHIKQKAG